jgi:hypothetical protein
MQETLSNPAIKVEEAKGAVRVAMDALEEALAALKGSRAEDYLLTCNSTLQNVFEELVLAKRLVK